MSTTRASVLPRNVLLFSGHMIDAPERPDPRFPPNKEFIAAETIAKTLLQLDANPSDLAICSGACGGDLLFAESCLARGVKLELYIPFEVSTFLAKSVDFADFNWRERFFAAQAQAKLHIMPAELGPTAQGEDPYERNNLWMLDEAGRFGDEKVVFVCLWDGRGGDGRGGTQHLMEAVRRKSGRTIWLDTTIL